MKANPVELLEAEGEIFPDPFLEELREAIGLATTIVPDMPVDVDNPIGMIKRVEEEVNLLRERIAILSCTHPLFSVYRCNKRWIAEYRGKTGRLKLEGCESANEALRAVQGWKAITE